MPRQNPTRQSILPPRRDHPKRRFIQQPTRPFNPGSSYPSALFSVPSRLRGKSSPLHFKSPVSSFMARAPHVGWWSVSGRFETTLRHPRLFPIIDQTSTCEKPPPTNRPPTQLRAFVPPFTTPSLWGDWGVKTGRFNVGLGRFGGGWRDGSIPLWGRFFRPVSTAAPTQT